MRRLVTAFTVCVILGGPLTPAGAGGKFSGRHGSKGHVGSVTHFSVQPVPIFQPKSAFGSPGGFPFPASGADHKFHKFHGHLAHRFKRHPVVTWWPSTALLYGQPAQAEPSAAASSPVINVSPVVYLSPTVYVTPPVAAAEPAPIVAAGPAAPPPATVIEYSTGRYELRGDGVTDPLRVGVDSQPARRAAAGPRGAVSGIRPGLEPRPDVSVDQ